MVVLAVAVYVAVGVVLAQWWCRDDPTSDGFDCAGLVPVWPLVAFALVYLWFLDWWADDE